MVSTATMASGAANAMLAGHLSRPFSPQFRNRGGVPFPEWEGRAAFHEVRASVASAACQTRRPLAVDRFRSGEQLVAGAKIERALRRPHTRDRIVECRTLSRTDLDSRQQRSRIVDFHDKHVVIWTGLDRTQPTQHTY